MINKEKFREFIEFANTLGRLYPFEESSWMLSGAMGEICFDLPDASAYGVCFCFDKKVMTLSRRMPREYRIKLIGLAKYYDFEIEMTEWKPHGS